MDLFVSSFLKFVMLMVALRSCIRIVRRYRYQSRHHTTIIVVKSITLENAQMISKRIYNCPTKRLDIILHTFGGDHIGTMMIAKALDEFNGIVYAWVPHYAHSGGAVLALVAMCRPGLFTMSLHSTLGMCDPQTGVYSLNMVENIIRYQQKENSMFVVAEDVVVARFKLKQAMNECVQMVSQSMIKFPEKFPLEKLKFVVDQFFYANRLHESFYSRQECISFGLPIVGDAIPREIYECV